MEEGRYQDITALNHTFVLFPFNQRGDLTRIGLSDKIRWVVGNQMVFALDKK